MTEIVDLDKVVPEKVILRMGDKDIELQHPSLGHYFELQKVAIKMQQVSYLSTAELQDLEREMKDVVVKICPELADIPLVATQLNTVYAAISRMAMPPKEEDEERGIDTRDPKA